MVRFFLCVVIGAAVGTGLLVYRTHDNNPSEAEVVNVPDSVEVVEEKEVLTADEIRARSVRSAKIVVQQRLQVPTQLSGIQIREDGGVHHVTGFVDYQSTYGHTVRARFECQVRDFEVYELKIHHDGGFVLVR